MKIVQLDEQWPTFNRNHKSLKVDITNVLPSFQHIQVPRSLQQSFNNCIDLSQLKYYRDYTNFVINKRSSPPSDKPLNQKMQIIKQVCDKGIDIYLSQSQIFLSPAHFTLNMKNRVQNYKPKTPSLHVDKMFRRFLNQRKSMPLTQIQQQIQDRQADYSNIPLLHPNKRIKTISQFLAIQLYNYPQLRKMLKQKYMKKVVISTLPTAKGAHVINIYNQFFPVKRINNKPAYGFDGKLWILAQQAQALGLINIQMKFQWQLTATSHNQRRNFDGDTVYSQLIKYYYDLTSQSTIEDWNLLRKQVLQRMLGDFYFTGFFQQLKEQLTNRGNQQIINQCCQKFKQKLNRRPALSQGLPVKILAMVLQQQKLGLAFVDQFGKQHSMLSIQLKTDDQLKQFINDKILYDIIQQHSPNMILVAANCRRAQTLRKQLRTDGPSSQIFVAFGQYQIPNLMANKQIIQGSTTQKCILEAISMARLKKNPIAQILALWSQNIQQNGIYSLNLHPLQRYVDKRKLLKSLQSVAIEMVNLVGVDIQQIRNIQNFNSVLQFVCGLGPRKAFALIEKIRQKCPNARFELLSYLSGQIVYKNCAPFIKFQKTQHMQIIKQKIYSKKSKGDDRNEIHLLDRTRIPEQWYQATQKLFLNILKQGNFIQLKHKKTSMYLTDQQIAIKQFFKSPQKLRTLQWDTNDLLRQFKAPKFFDSSLIKSQMQKPWQQTRQLHQLPQNKQIFYSLLKQSPQTLKKYMVVTVKVLSVSRGFLNVVIPQNGLFGFIKLPSDKINQNSDKPQYQKGQYIKAVITGFPFDQKRKQRGGQGDQQAQLLKVDMSLSFPHKHQQKSNDCTRCLRDILRQIHPNIDLDRDNFDLSKQQMPVVQIKQQNSNKIKNQYKRISHPKFKNININTAIQQVKQLKIGDFIIRPSNQGANFLTITWHFYKGIIGHIKLKLQTRNEGTTSITIFKIMDTKKDKQYSSIDQIVQKYLKPMNRLVADVISNKKFISAPLQQIQQKVRIQARQQSYIQYFFGCSPQFPQFFVLVYMYKQKKPTKQLIRVKNQGLYFHGQTFNSLRQLISFFKQNLRQKKYQSYVKMATPSAFKK